MGDDCCQASAKDSPAALLRRIEAMFRDRAFGSTVTLAYRGEKYLVRCDTDIFAVYRVVEQGHVPPGRPGWPFCLVTAEAVVE